MADQRRFWTDTCQLQTKAAWGEKGSALRAPAPVWEKAEAKCPRAPAEAAGQDEAERLAKQQQAEAAQAKVLVDETNNWCQRDAATCTKALADKQNCQHELARHDAV
jgi:hypothetical protein